MNNDIGDNESNWEDGSEIPDNDVVYLDDEEMKIYDESSDEEGMMEGHPEDENDEDEEEEEEKMQEKETIKYDDTSLKQFSHHKGPSFKQGYSLFAHEKKHLT